MFNNPGGKIKGFAIVVFVINILAFLVLGIVLISEVESVALGLLTILVGAVISWLSVLFIYAYGNMVEDVEVIRKSIDNRG